MMRKKLFLLLGFVMILLVGCTEQQQGNIHEQERAKEKAPKLFQHTDLDKM